MQKTIYIILLVVIYSLGISKGIVSPYFTLDEWSKVIKKRQRISKDIYYCNEGEQVYFKAEVFFDDTSLSYATSMQWEASDDAKLQWTYFVSRAKVISKVGSLIFTRVNTAPNLDLDIILYRKTDKSLEMQYRTGGPFSLVKITV